MTETSTTPHDQQLSGIEEQLKSAVDAELERRTAGDRKLIEQIRQIAAEYEKVLDGAAAQAHSFPGGYELVRANPLARLRELVTDREEELAVAAVEAGMPQFYVADSLRKDHRRISKLVREHRALHGVDKTDKVA